MSTAAASPEPPKWPPGYGILLMLVVSFVFWGSILTLFLHLKGN